MARAINLLIISNSYVVFDLKAKDIKQRHTYRVELQFEVIKRTSINIFLCSTILQITKQRRKRPPLSSDAL